MQGKYELTIERKNVDVFLRKRVVPYSENGLKIQGRKKLTIQRMDC